MLFLKKNMVKMMVKSHPEKTLPKFEMTLPHLIAGLHWHNLHHKHANFYNDIIMQQCPNIT